MTDTTSHEVAPQTHVCVAPPDEWMDKWSVTGDLRAPGSGWDGDENYDVADALRLRYLEGFDFDPESSCFYAYVTSEADAMTLVEAIKEWMSEKGRPCPTT